MRVSTGARIGPYEVVGLVGAGGMGEVYRARDTRLQRPVAIKVITANLTDPDVVRRFESEALCASALNHPNIVTVHEFGVHDGLHYLVTEFVEGETVRTRLERGRLPVPEALDIAIQMLTALEAAHAAGLIHRDVKPENVMLRRDGYVKVLDFGLAKLAPTAKAASENLTISLRTTPGTILGTVGYMSPEQIRGLPVDQRADVWSSGVVLHEMISGQSPFTAPTVSDVIASVLDREPPPFSTYGVTVPAELERIVRKALAKKPDDRYQTIKDALIDLRSLRQELERRTTPSGAVGFQRRNGRRVLLVSTAMAGAIIVTLLLVGGQWLDSRSSSGAAAESPAVLPMRRVEYWLTVQKMRDGKPYQDPFDSSGQEIFENGWKFRFNFRSPDAGYLYLLNQGPSTTGVSTLHILFPMPSVIGGTPSVAGGQPVQTDWYVFDENQGTERFWIVWSAGQIADLEKARRWVNPSDRGHVKDPHEAVAIQKALEKYGADVRITTDKATRRTVLESRAPVVANLAELEHH